VWSTAGGRPWPYHHVKTVAVPGEGELDLVCREPVRAAGQRMTRPGATGALDPAYFALVMATGVVSIILHSHGWRLASDALLGLGLAVLVVLLAMGGWTLYRYRHMLTAIAVDPRRALIFFAVVAAWDVLSTRLSMAGFSGVAIAFLIVGGAALLVFTHAIPIALMIRRDKQPARLAANGTWIIWVVGIQSVVIAAASIPGEWSVRLASLAVVCWSVGVVLYAIITTIVLAQLLFLPLSPAEWTPPNWVLMGGTAISTVAGLQTLRLRPDTLVAETSPVIAGLSVVLWAFGTWLIPLLVLLDGWKYVVRRIPLSYEPAWWSLIFVTGMYGLASQGLGALLRVPWITGLGSTFEWITVVLWVVTFVAMLWSLARTASPTIPQADE
jgi:tellurite resistance protein TehA-like permease